MTLRRAALAWLAYACGSAAGAGLDTCPCLDSLPIGIEQYEDGNELTYSSPTQAQVWRFPLDYGQSSCTAHDLDLPPVCDNANARPAWCTAKWCYVGADCTGAAKFPSKFFPALENLFFSYGTCAAAEGTTSNTITEMTSEDKAQAKQVVQLVDGYTRAARWQIEQSYETQAAADSVECSTTGNEMCESGTADGTCTGCGANSIWKTDVNFMSVGFHAGSGGTTEEKELAECMYEGVSSAFQRVVGKEADPDFERVGYMYFGDQATGSYTSWPNEKMCDADYDPRFRPWYASGATGPKDVIVIVDVSGSMMMGDPLRSELALQAVEALLDTLTWKDFATIILFNARVSAVYSSKLVALTDNKRTAMKAWARSQNWASGSTNFQAPIAKAFEIIEESVEAGSSSMCQKAIMFLTDGEADFVEADFNNARTKSLELDAIFFTYTIGSNADETVAKRLACENKGVFYPVPDGGDLPHIMSSYYEYFSHGQELCSASFIKYTSSTAGQTLYAGCMPFYDRTKPSPEILGVSCMDVNLLTEISELQEKSSWDYFVCITSDMTKMCRQVDLADCHLQKIRKAYGESSVCTESGVNEYSDVTADTVCPCTDQGCQDDLTFMDEKGYFCDTWVGDSCTNPSPSFGYSLAGLQEVQTKCKRSCGLCPWSSGACGRASALECPIIPVADECRACIPNSKTSGVGIDEQNMRCPGEDSPPANGGGGGGGGGGGLAEDSSNGAPPRGMWAMLLSLLIADVALRN